MTKPEQPTTRSSHRRQERAGKSRTDSSKKEGTPSSTSKTSRKDGLRETIESVVVAFILAFLFRTFEAEAFVIPTGSMAPTLYGRHKEIECEKCNYLFAIGASDEVDKDGYFHHRIETACCPNCRYRTQIEQHPVFKGDRILVNKFPYEFGDPQRWDVLVFKYPEEPQTNYIKRLIGLPGETLRIQQGNILRRTDSGWQVLRKQDPDKQRRLQLLVYDNDYPESDLHKLGWPTRWAAVERTGAPDGIAGWSPDRGGWVDDSAKHAFQLDLDRTSNGRHRWLRYRHIVPTQKDWDAAAGDDPDFLSASNSRPRLISDFCGYNAYTGGAVYGGGLSESGYYWVGDLTLNCTVDIQEAGSEGELLLELNEGSRQFQCRFNIATGEATLLHTVGLDDGEADAAAQDTKILATAMTGLKGPGSYKLMFANVDDRLCLWVDDRLVDFGDGAEYSPWGNLDIERPWDDDLIPVGIAARGIGVRVSHLRIERDTYYRSEFLHPDDQFRDGGRTVHEIDQEGYLADLLYDPDAWAEEYASRLSFNSDEYEGISFEFELGPDEYFMMGDNSPRSKDSRLWPNVRGARHRHAVPRTALVGKAFYVYWPHGVPFMNGGNGFPVLYHKQQRFHPDGRGYTESTNYPSFRFPFYPYVSRMRRIR